MLNHIAPFAVQSGEGKTLKTPTGDEVTIKATTRQTNGSLTVLETLFGPGNRTPDLRITRVFPCAALWVEGPR